MIPKLGLLQHNFREIYSIQGSTGSFDQQLVASPWRNRLYNPNAGWGVFYRFVYVCFLGEKRRGERVKKVVVQTHEIYKANIPLVEKLITNYREQISKRIKGNPINSKEHQNCRWYLTKWFDATYPFLEMMHQSNTPLSGYIKNCFDKEVTPFTCESFFKRILSFQRILDLEGLFQKPLPYQSLHKLATSVELVAKEKEEMEEWVRFLNKHSEKISVRFLHQFLQAFVAELPKEGAAPDLAKLEMGLIDHECKIFLQRDSEHIIWRERLRPGDAVQVNNQKIILGERIGNKKDGFDQTIHFAIRGDPDKILTISSNLSILGLRKILSEEQGFAVKMPAYLEIDESGKVALVEKLSVALNEFPWTSQKDQASAEDEDLIAPLAGLINWFVKEKMSPHHLSPKHLMFDTKGELKSLKLVLKTPAEDFDFNFLVKFVQECAAGNLRVFQHLMEASGLHSHPYTQFYEKVVHNALLRNTTTVDMQADLDGIVDSRILTQAEELHRQIQDLELECVQKVCSRCEAPAQTMNPTISKQLREQYRMSSSAGIIWPGIRDDVIENTIMILKVPVFTTPVKEPRIVVLSPGAIVGGANRNIQTSEFEDS